MGVGADTHGVVLRGGGGGSVLVVRGRAQVQQCLKVDARQAFSVVSEVTFESYLFLSLKYI